MAGEPKDQKAPDKAKLDRGPDKSIDPSKIAVDLAREELDFKQKAEKEEAAKKLQKEKAGATKAAADKRADLLVSSPTPQAKVEPAKVETVPAKIEQAKPTVEPAKVEATAAPKVETPVATPDETAQFNDVIKKLSDSSMSGDLANFLKKVESAPADAAFTTLATQLVEKFLPTDLKSQLQEKKITKLQAFRSAMSQIIEYQKTVTPAETARFDQLGKSFNSFVDAASAKKVETTTTGSPSTAPTGNPTPTPPTAPAPEKSFGDKIKDFFKDFFASISGFFSKLFGKKPETPTVAPAPSPTGTPSVTPSPRVETGGRENWRAVINSEAQRLGIEPAFAMAIITVEAGKVGLTSDGKPVIRFEPHVFNKQLASRGIEKHGGWGSSTLTGRNVDGVSCEGGQANEHACFQKALQINKDAAYNSMSMGLGQIMGFNAGTAGYPSAENMFQSFSAGGGGEVEQIKAMFRLIEKTPAQLSACRRKDFGAFTRAYNGSSPGSDLYARYVSGMQNAYAKNGGGTSSGNQVV